MSDGNSVAAARAIVESLRKELEAKEKQVLASLSREEVLAERPDLLEADRTAQNLYYLDGRYRKLQSRYEQERLMLLRAKPFSYPGLVEGPEYYNWLISELEPGKRLTFLLHNDRLWPEHREFVKKALAYKTYRG